MQKHILVRSGVVATTVTVLLYMFFTRHEKQTITWYSNSGAADSFENDIPGEEDLDSTPAAFSMVTTAAALESLVTITTDATYVSSFSTATAVASWDTMPTSESTEHPEDKIVVMAKLQREDTSWVTGFLPDWQHAIYTVDNLSQPLHAERNKGREANVYLLYIIQNYYDLPSTVAFVHSHRDGWPGGWHTDAAGYDNVESLNSLNIDFVQRNGYANLRCIWNPGCPDEVQPLREPPKVDGEGRSTERDLAEVWPLFFDPIPLPHTIGTPCCAQFAVSRDQVHERSLEDYQGYHNWLMNTELDDYVSGRIFEYLWHIIFGQNPVYCPDLYQCYYDVYGRSQPRVPLNTT